MSAEGFMSSPSWCRAPDSSLRIELTLRVPRLRRTRSVDRCPGAGMLTARGCAHRRSLQAAPEQVRESPQHAGGHRPAPRLRAVAHSEVRDERRAEVDGEAGVGPLDRKSGGWGKRV